MKSLHDMRGEYRAARRRYGRAYNTHFKQSRLRPLTGERIRANERNYSRLRFCEVEYMEREKALCTALSLDPFAKYAYGSPYWHEILMGRTDRRVRR